MAEPMLGMIAMDRLKYLRQIRIFKMDMCKDFLWRCTTDVEHAWMDRLALHRSQLGRPGPTSASMHSLTSAHFGLDQAPIWPHHFISDGST